MITFVFLLLYLIQKKKKKSELSFYPGKVLYCAQIKEGSVCIFAKIKRAELIHFYASLNNKVKD